MVRTGKGPPRTIPQEPAQTMGYRFPSTPATPKQLVALRRLMLAYLRNHVCKEFSQVSVELLGELFGLQERQAKSVVSQSRGMNHTSYVELVLRLLHAMHTGEIAGVLGTPKSMDTRWLFRLVYEFDPTAERDDLPKELRRSWVPLPSDAIHGPGDHRARIRDADGKEKTVNVWSSTDGFIWMEEPGQEQDFNVLVMWHSAFRVEYREWLRGE